MAFRCPACGGHALEIGLTLELPYDADWDEITLQLARCSRCGQRALAVYRESRHGALDSETVWHTGYRVSDADFDAVAALLAACPRPTDGACPCAAHQRLGGHRGGRWLGLPADIHVESEFELD
jgi:DNA-directed RNA polymerase subunit RPC12/RpoP